MDLANDEDEFPLRDLGVFMPVSLKRQRVEYPPSLFGPTPPPSQRDSYALLCAGSQSQHSLRGQTILRCPTQSRHSPVPTTGIGVDQTSCRCLEQLFSIHDRLSLHLLKDTFEEDQQRQVEKSQSSNSGQRSAASLSPEEILSIAATERSLELLRDSIEHAKAVLDCKQCAVNTQIHSLQLHVCEKMTQTVSIAKCRLELLRDGSNGHLRRIDRQDGSNHNEIDDGRPLPIKPLLAEIFIGECSIVCLAEWVQVVRALLELRIMDLLDVLRTWHARSSISRNELVAFGTKKLISQVKQWTEKP